MESIKEKIPAPQKRLKVILRHHVALGVESMYSCFFSVKDPRKMPFHHVLNRLMVIAQIPAMFVVVEDENYRPIYSSNKHKNDYHQATIALQVEKVVSTPALRKQHLIPIWHRETPNESTTPDWYEKVAPKKKYYLLILGAYDAEYTFPPLRRIGNSKNVASPLDAALYVIEKVLDPRKYFHYGEVFFECLLSSLETAARLDQKIDKKSEQGNFWDIFLDPSDPARRTETREICEKYLYRSGTPYALAGEGVMDRVYDNVKSSVLSISSHEKPDVSETITNCLLYTQSYDRYPGHLRSSGKHSYNVRLAIGEKQKLEIMSAMKKWHERRNEKQRQFLQALPEGKDDSSERTRKLALEVSIVFWKKIETHAGRQEICTILHEYLGDSARSIAEPVFEGISFFRNPFMRHAGLERCFLNEQIPMEDFSSLEQQTQSDLLRLITFHYLLQEMAPLTKEEAALEDSIKPSLYVMLNPIEVGGRVWAVSVYAARAVLVESKFFKGETYISEEMKDSLGKSELLPRKRIEHWNRYWLQNFHLYHDVHERLKRSIRQHLKTAYCEMLADLYASKHLQCRDELERCISLGIPMDAVDSAINDALRGVQCFFPYDDVSVSILPEDGREYTVPFRDALMPNRHKPKRANSFRNRPQPLAGAQEMSDKAGKAFSGRYLVAKIVMKPNHRYPRAPGGNEAGRVFLHKSELAVAFTDAMFRHYALFGEKSE